MKSYQTYLKKYLDYWDDWHNRWYNNISQNPPNLNQIKNWKVPLHNGGNKNSIWHYFPEPYWGNPFLKQLDSVFININPGAGGDCQDLLFPNMLKGFLYTTYHNNNNLYSKTVSHLIKNNSYTTTNWFNKKRVNWLNQVYQNLNITSTCNLETILCADLIPWHTTNASYIKKYIDNNRHLIEKHIIIPIAKISQFAKIKGLIFAKGRIIEDLFISIGVKVSEYKSGIYRIIIFRYNTTTILVFVGGQGMSLPNTNKLYTSTISKDSLRIYEIFNKYLQNQKL